MRWRRVGKDPLPLRLCRTTAKAHRPRRDHLALCQQTFTTAEEEEELAVEVEASHSSRPLPRRHRRSAQRSKHPRRFPLVGWVAVGRRRGCPSRVASAAPIMPSFLVAVGPPRATPTAIIRTRRSIAAGEERATAETGVPLRRATQQQLQLPVVEGVGTARRRSRRSPSRALPPSRAYRRR